jgi:CPA2 family monovalent cation:H+ antiporter-2
MALDFSASGFRDALVVLGAAGIVIPAFARFRITPVIGFLMVGVIVGPYGLGALVNDYPWLDWVSIADKKAIDPYGELGIILLLFTIGLELSFRRLWSMRRRVFGLGPAQVAASAVLIAAALVAFGWPWTAAFGLGVALALSSTALVMPMTGTTSSLGRLAFPMLLFQDLAIVPIIFLLGALGMSSGGLEGLVWISVAGMITIAAMFVLGRYALPPLFAQAARTKSPELFMSASLLVVILASFATAASGLSPIVGALIAGLVIAETEYRQEVEATVKPFKGLALGIFLISVGMSIDLSAMLAQWQALVLAVCGVVVIKAIVIFLLLRLGRVAPGLSTEVAVLMSSPSELTLIVLAASVQAGLIGTDDAAFWQLVTAIGLTITPLLARIGHDVARRVEWRHQTSSAPQPEVSLPGRTIVIGYGRVGRMVGDMLDAHDQPWVALEGNVDSVALGRRAGRDVRFGDASKAHVIDSLDPESARAVVLTMDDPVQSTRLVRRLRARFPDLTIVARARDPDHAADLYKAGASDAVPETLESSLQLSESVLVDLGVAMGPVIASIHEKREELRTAIKHRGELEKAPRLRPSKR